MGFKDDFSSMVNRGTAAASRKAKQVSLGSKANELRRQRQTLVAQLGASLYEEVRATPSLRVGREELIAQIEAVDAQRRQIEEEQRRIQMETEDAQVRANVYHCAVCGAPIRATDQFCSTCGAPADQAIPKGPAAAPVQAAVPDGPTCPNCGAPIAEGDVFCMSCGTKIEVVAAAPAPAPAPEPEPVAAPAPAPAPEPVFVPEPAPEPVFVPEPAPVVEDVVTEVEELSAVDDWRESEFVQDFAAVSIPTPQPPVTNEQLESEVESAIAEELQIEDMVEEIKDEIEAPAPAPAPEPAPEPMPAPEVDVVAEASTRTCPNCGEPVPEGDLFCMSCGHRMDEPVAAAPAPAPRFCQNCGAPVEEVSKFCGNCGAPVA